MLLIPVFTYRLRDMRLYAPLRNDFFQFTMQFTTFLH